MHISHSDCPAVSILPDGAGLMIVISQEFMRQVDRSQIRHMTGGGLDRIDNICSYLHQIVQAFKAVPIRMEEDFGIRAILDAGMKSVRLHSRAAVRAPSVP